METWKKRLDELIKNTSPSTTPELFVDDIKSFISQELEKAREEAVKDSKSVRGYQMGHEAGTREERKRAAENALAFGHMMKQAGIKHENDRIIKLLSEMKRWVATIQRQDEYVVRDKDLQALKDKL